MSPHTRKADYWINYHTAHAQLLGFLISNIICLVESNPPPNLLTRRKRKGPAGRRPVHSPAKMNVLCLLMVILNISSRNMESIAGVLNTPWRDEPVPDHTYLARWLEGLPTGWLRGALNRTARMCIAAHGGDVTDIAVDSSGIETDRHHTTTRVDKKARKYAQKLVKTYLKWHIIAVTGLQIILSVRTTPDRVADTVMLPPLLRDAVRAGHRLARCMLHADRGYDSDRNCRETYELGLTPNIKQRKNAISRGKVHRRRAAGTYDEVRYKNLRGLVEGVFGGMESGDHGLHCRFRKAKNQERFGQIIAIGWNLKVLCRLEAARKHAQLACRVRDPVTIYP